MNMRMGCVLRISLRSYVQFIVRLRFNVRFVVRLKVEIKCENSFETNR